MRLERQDILGVGLRGDDGNIAVVIDEKTKDVLLDSEIVCHDARASLTLARGGPQSPGLVTGPIGSLPGVCCRPPCRLKR